MKVYDRLVRFGFIFGIFEIVFLDTPPLFRSAARCFAPNGFDKLVFGTSGPGMVIEVNKNTLLIVQEGPETRSSSIALPPAVL